MYEADLKSTSSRSWSERLLGANDPEILNARYYSLLNQIPLLILCVQVAILPQFLLLFEGKYDTFLILTLGSVEYFSVHLFLFWLRNRGRERDADFVRRKLGLFSIYLILGGIASAGSLLQNLTGNQGGIDYALYYGGLICSLSFPVMLIMLGRSAYFYCLCMLAAGIFALHYTALPSAWASTVTVIVLGLGSMCALHRQSQRFDRLVKSQADTEALSQENARLASLDMLTGLRNRRHFFDHVDRAYDEAISHNRVFVLGVLDLDDFKRLNDTFGHTFGDRVLETVGRRLSALDSTTLHFHRIGGDEFSFYMSIADETVDLDAWARSVLRILEEPVKVDGRAVHTTASIGMAVAPQMSDDPKQLHEYADYALYTAKRRGKGLVEIFSAVHLQAMQSERQLEQALRSADLDKEIVAVFQPIVDARSGAPDVFEILARWDSPTLGLVSPVAFIPVAERIGLISTITLIMLRRGLTAMADWPERVGLSLNLSAHDIMNAAVVGNLIEHVRNSGVSSSRITLEITETAVLSDIERVLEHFDLLKDAGMRVALDDFGSGFTSLGQLQFLNLDKIKLDKAFATDIQNNPTNAAIVKSLVDLCHSLDMELVVEGAEDEAVSATLRDLGCTYLQGYCFSKPVTRSEALRYILRFADSPDARSLAGARA
ncbi:putative bifunctional diguanylate cyclase/phosphodiesterase [Hoeflea sp.]|uniref:putative bifunctional diguanylate cyclase/phosphodiesterase n=1 Tax=Hoeflea sp. TaxID=1940281 RepID=UPI0037485424